MTQLQRFIEFCRKNPGHTLHDLLMMAGFHTRESYRHIKHELTRRLVPGSELSELAMKRIIVPSPEERGRWAEGLDRAEDQIAEQPQSKAIADTRRTDLTSLPPDYRMLIEDVLAADPAGRIGALVNKLARFAITDKRHDQELIASLKDRLGDLKDQVEDLRLDKRALWDVIRANQLPSIRNRFPVLFCIP